jgi:hypothetical protein
MFRVLQVFQKNLRISLVCFIIAFSFSYPLLSYSQTKSHIITGYVVDSLSQNPIPNVHIVSVENNIGLITNNEGFFKMIVPSHPIIMEFTFLGYQSKQIQFSNNSDTNIIIKLLEKTYELHEIDVNSDKNTYNARINKYSVLDYSFIGDSLLILQKRRSIGGIPSLVLLNRNYDTILFKNDIPKGAYRLFKDCINYHHIITEDSAYQIAIDQKNISLFEPFEVHWFNQVFENCLFRKEGDIFFELPIYQGYGHEIIFINEEDKTKELFLRYIDTESLTNLVEDISEISSMYYLHSVVNAATNDSATIAHINKYNADSRYIKEIGDPPIMNTICLLNDTIHYFNYYESIIQSFSSLNTPPVETDIDFKNTKGCKAKLLIDPLRDKIYLISKSKAYYQVYLVDTNLGKLTFLTKISIFKGDNLKVNNGFLYYLTSPSSSVNQVKRLSRIKLDDD